MDNFKKILLSTTIKDDNYLLKIGGVTIQLRKEEAINLAQTISKKFSTGDKRGLATANIVKPFVSTDALLKIRR